MTRILGLILFASFSFMAQACSAPSDGSQGQIPLNSSANEALIGLDGNWQLTDAKGLDVRPVNLKISGQAYSLNAGCNSMGGQFQMNKGVMTVQTGPSTLMACPDDYDRDLTRHLVQSENYYLIGDTLTFSGPSGELEFKRLKTSSQLNGDWKIQGLNINGGVVSSLSQPLQTVKFSNGMFSGFDGCNTVMGRYTFSDDVIQIKSDTTTEKFCEMEADGDDWVKSYHEALSKAHTVKSRLERLELRKKDGSLLMALTRP